MSHLSRHEKIAISVVMGALIIGGSLVTYRNQQEAHSVHATAPAEAGSVVTNEEGVATPGPKAELKPVVLRTFDNGQSEVQLPNGNTILQGDAKEPVRDWHAVQREVFVAEVGRLWVLGPYDNLGTETRFDVKTASPVTIAITDAVYRDGLLHNLRRYDPSIAVCSRSSVLETSLNCHVPMTIPQYVLVLFDERQSSTLGGIVALGLAWKGASGPLNNLSLRNDVAIQHFDWQCVSSCGNDIPEYLKDHPWRKDQ